MDWRRSVRVGLVAIGAPGVILAAWWLLRVDASSTKESAPREYAALAPTSRDDPSLSAGTLGDSNPPGDRVDSEPSEEEKKRIAAARVREAEANRVLGRPAGPFDSDRLREFGFGDEEIARIKKDFSEFAAALRAESPGRPIAAAYRLEPDEREARRRLRARYLTDREFDAALFATNQANRVEIARIRPGARTRQVGLRSGDQIISINGIRVFDLPDFEDGRAAKQPGELHELTILRGETLFDVTVQCCRAGWSGMAVTLARPLPESMER